MERMYQRLIEKLGEASEESHIGPHLLRGCVGERSRGMITAQDAQRMMNFDDSEAAAFDTGPASTRSTNFTSSARI